MNALKQASEGIFASEKDLKELAKKEEAKILVVSDSHGCKAILQNIIEKYSADCDALIFTGDGVCDLLTIMEESVHDPELKKALPPVIVFVKGNNDPFQYLANFSHSHLHIGSNTNHFTTITIPKEVKLQAAGRKILVVHGHEQGVYYSPALLTEYAEKEGCNVAVYGHTHVPAENPYTVYSMNAGSVAHPRNLSNPGFAFMFLIRNAVYSTFFQQKNRLEGEYTPFIPPLMY